MELPEMPDLNSPEWKKFGEDGLEVWDVKVGEGDDTKADAKVRIHYTGWTTDGEVFDSSVSRNATAFFPLKNLIKGWQVGIPGMKPGGVRRLKIPYQLAYGEAGRPPKIPAKATLIFEIELYPDPMAKPDQKSDQWKKADGGARIWDVKIGTGVEVKPRANVTIHYTGWTEAGKVFDSSLNAGRPVSFPLTDLIKGWQLHVPGMKVGGIRRMELPPDLAYGAAGAPPDIPANATLIFEIEVAATR
ncbi:MAG: FKBP-type peptidyl-prolyl cis-trans isomerase [Fimbriiglobus sp.]